MNFNGYKIVSKIFEGNHSSILKVYREELEMAFAIKRFDVEGFEDHFEMYRKQSMFLNEAEVLARVAHPGIVRFYDLIRDEEGALGIVMELLEGGSLDEVGQIDPVVAGMIAVRVLSALNHLSRGISIGERYYNSVSHGDIKPSNIFISSKGVKLVDFGCSCPNPGNDDKIYGSVKYMSHNVLAGNTCGWKDDFYSLSITMLEKAWGVKPFEGMQLKDASLIKSKPINIPKEVKKHPIGKVFSLGATNPKAFTSIGNVIEVLTPEIGVVGDWDKYITGSISDFTKMTKQNKKELICH